ncbi:MAG: hypothetical protein ABUL62_01735 [Myxococcales bacterium]
MSFAGSRFAHWGAALGVTLAGCSPATPAHSAPAPPPAAAPSPAPSPVPAATSPVPAEPAPDPAALGRPCGDLHCLAFATPQAAFAYVLRAEPRVLAVGEAHAQQGNPKIASSTRRFAEQLLPLLAGRSKDIVIELLVANCKQQTVTGVAKTQAPVTEHQAQSNQSEFVTLGKYAQRLGIEPHALNPSCSEYDSVLAAGEDGVARLLGLVAEQTEKTVTALLAQPVPPAPSGTPIVLTYGGALHNDLHPRAGQESWSFGPQLFAASHGRYVELDLIVPEFVKDSEAWRNLPWFSAFDREHLPREALLYEPTPGSFTLIFPKTDSSAPQG